MRLRLELPRGGAGPSSRIVYSRLRYGTFLVVGVSTRHDNCLIWHTFDVLGGLFPGQGRNAMVGGDSHAEAGVGVGDEPDRSRHSSERVTPARQTHDVTLILSQIEQGDPNAAEQLLPLVYEELRKLAAQKLINEKPGQTLQATALVHEAYIRLVDVERAQQWDSRGHFFVAAAEAMRRILLTVLATRAA